MSLLRFFSVDSCCDAVICMEGLIVLAKKKENMNEKIVRLYKEGYNFDEISKLLTIPKGNIVGIVEKYFPDYQSYQQPQIDHAAIDEKESKSTKSKIPNVGGFFKRNGKDKDSHNNDNVTINLEMDEEGFLDKTTQGIANMLKNGKSAADTAEFFNRSRADIQAVEEVMGEHFRRVEAHTPPAPKPPEPTEEEKKFSNFATGLEAEVSKPVRPKYTPPTYSKRDDPKPVSAAYGLAAESKPVIKVDDPADEVKEEPKEEKPVSLLEEEVETKDISLLEKEEETKDISLLEQEPETKDISLLEQEEETAEISLTDADEPEENKVSLIDDDNESSSENDNSVSLIDPIEMPDEEDEEEFEIPSIEPVSLEALEKELVKAPEPVEDIPEIGYENKSEEDNSEIKEVSPSMGAMEKMKQFAQEQIALNNKKIEELKTKKTDAENDAFDCNTKVEAMKKEIEDMQAKLLVLIDEKDKAGKVVSDINEEIEAINKENADYGTYL